jgi:opacity protein-like surface antigen
MLKILMAVVLGVVAQAASAADDEFVFYLGASAGRTKTGDAGCLVDPNVMPCDRSNNSYGFQVGLERGIWAFELGYKSLGRIADSNDGMGNYSIIKTKLAEADVLVQYPIWRLAPYLKGGAYFARNALDSTIVAPANGNQGGWTYGAGIRFDILKNFGARVEWQRYNNVGQANVGFRADVETTTLGAVLRF